MWTQSGITQFFHTNKTSEHFCQTLKRHNINSVKLVNHKLITGSDSVCNHLLNKANVLIQKYSDVLHPHWTNMPIVIFE